MVRERERAVILGQLDPDRRFAPPGPAMPEDETLRRAIALVRVVRDPAFPGLVFLTGVLLCGGGVLAFTALKVISTPFVPLQTPFVVSGALGGLALVAVGALLAAVLAERRDRAVARAEAQRVVDGVAALVHATLAVRRPRA